MCSSQVITKYQKRISGPLLDRIDIHIQVPRVEYDKLSDERYGESSNTIQKRVQLAREIQINQFADTYIYSNADMHPAEVRKCCVQDETCKNLM